MVWIYICDNVLNRSNMYTDYRETQHLYSISDVYLYSNIHRLNVRMHHLLPLFSKWSEETDPLTPTACPCNTKS